jgi:hypothetical protein
MVISFYAVLRANVLPETQFTPERILLATKA